MDISSLVPMLRGEGTVAFCLAAALCGAVKFRMKTMKKFALALAASAVAATAAFAQEAPVVADADANGTFSLVEVQAAYAAATEEAFKAADTDASGELSAEELAAAVAANAFAG
jgi:hypothetical protein